MSIMPPRVACPSVSAPRDAAASGDFDLAVQQTHLALDAFVRGDPGPILSIFSERDDVVLANPFGPPRRGRIEVERATEQAAALFRDGTCRYEEISRYVTPDLGYIHELERAEAKTGGNEEFSTVSLRVTMIYRREGDTWKIVHRHADPITAPRSLDSIIDK